MRQSLDLVAKIGQPEGSTHLAEVRAILEPEIAALAAVRAQESDVVTMREAVGVMDEAGHDPDAYIEADLDFHLALAEGAANPLILSLIDSIVGLLREQRLKISKFPAGRSGGRFITRRFWMQSSGVMPSRRAAAMKAHLQQVRDDSQSSPGKRGTAK